MHRCRLPRHFCGLGFGINAGSCGEQVFGDKYGFVAETCEAGNQVGQAAGGQLGIGGWERWVGWGLGVG